MCQVESHYAICNKTILGSISLVWKSRLSDLPISWKPITLICVPADGIFGILTLHLILEN